jgi:hypothetical protein
VEVNHLAALPQRLEGLVIEVELETGSVANVELKT